MKKLFKVLETIAMLAVLFVSFVGCDDLLGSLIEKDPTTKDDTATDTYKPVVYTSYDTDGTKYELTITRIGKAVLQFTPATGDSFTLTITTKSGVTQTSTGQITDVFGKTFTLKHTGTGETFSVTVSVNSPSGGSMVSITGDIPINNSANKAPAPDELTSDPPGDTQPTIPASPNEPDTRLAGTWIAVNEGIGEAGLTGAWEPGKPEPETVWIEYTYKYTWTLKFTSTSTWTIDGKYEDTMDGERPERGSSQNGTYTLSGNNIVLRGNDIPSEGLSGTINGNTIVFPNATQNSNGTKEDLVFTRQ